MDTLEAIRQLIKDKVVVRHRTSEEVAGFTTQCIICNREVILHDGALCMVIDDTNLLCPVCGMRYAPEMAIMVDGQIALIEPGEKESIEVYINSVPDTKQIVEIKEDIEALLEVVDVLAKGMARGIVEAPVGHIGLMHYAKDIHKPARRNNESDKDYELRVRTFRIARLYEKINADTAGRIKRIVNSLKKLGFPLGE